MATVLRKTQGIRRKTMMQASWFKLPGKGTSSLESSVLSPESILMP